jgi:hypothetical protein
MSKKVSQNDITVFDNYVIELNVWEYKNESLNNKIELDNQLALDFLNPDITNPNNSEF